jgi:hypothetical protein
MTSKNPRRLALLTDLLSGFTTPEDASSVETEIALWIGVTAEEQQRKRSIVRRDLILQNGYKGAGAQTRFAADVFTALTGQPEALLAVLRDGDREVVLAALPHGDFAPVVVEPDAPVVEETPAPAPVVEQVVRPTPAPAATLTEQWFTIQMHERGLINRLAAMLRKRDGHADMDELRSETGLWLATWGQKGTFDAVIEEKGSVPFSWLCRALERKRTSGIYKGAQDALARQRGARTQHEINQRVELGISDYVAPESLAAGVLDVVTSVDEDGDRTYDFVCDEPTPEDLVEDLHDREFMIATGREIIASAYRDAKERYTAVYDALINGASTDEIATLDGCAHSRAMALKSKVRSALREGAQTREDAAQTLRLLRMEPWSTKTEIKTELRMDMPRLNRALALLDGSGMLRAGWGDTFAATIDE